MRILMPFTMLALLFGGCGSEPKAPTPEEPDKSTPADPSESTAPASARPATSATARKALNKARGLSRPPKENSE
jgi:hypothetical protein